MIGEGGDGGGGRKPDRQKSAQRQEPKQGQGDKGQQQPAQDAAEKARRREEQERNRLANIAKREKAAKEREEREKVAQGGKPADKPAQVPRTPKAPDKTPVAPPPKPAVNAPPVMRGAQMPEKKEPAAPPSSAAPIERKREEAKVPSRPREEPKPQPAPKAEKVAPSSAEPKKEAAERDFFAEAKTLAADVVRLEPLHEKFLADIAKHGLSFKFPSFWQFWKPGHILGSTVEEAGRIRRVTSPQGLGEKFGNWAAGLIPGGKGARFARGGMIKIEAEQVDIIRRYRDWLKSRAGSAEENSPEPSGIERRVAEALDKLDVPDMDAVLDGLIINLKGSSAKEKVPKARISRNEKGGNFDIRLNATVGDIQNAIRHAKNEKKPAEKKD